MTLATGFVDAIRRVVGDAPQVGLHVPDIGEAEKRFVAECLDSTFVSSVGPFVTRFEEEIAAFTGARHAIAVSNGTSALHVSLVLAGVLPGDEVIVPSLSFIATANAVSHAGATPYFIDSDEETMGMSPAALEVALSSLRRDANGLTNPVTGNRVSAIVPMHTLGHPADILGLLTVADACGVPIVEDAAESLGSWVGEKHTGTFGLLGVLSFNGNKIVTTGGGGMILTDDPELARRAKHLTTTAKLPHAWEFEHDEVAWNYRMPNLNAAMGVAQLTKLDGYLAAKREIAARYAANFADIPGLTFMGEPAGTTSNYWLCAVRVDGADLELRDELLRASNDDGLQCRPFWNLLSEQRMYSSCPKGDLTVATRLHASVISIPSSPAILG
ncbi:LegC family aminotransferase [Glaciihabitans arcticus]|uniref:LegC family aminotransferase n=1 Tax=Glaciihabitans arcticus TaxID=2668039 RepID=A0A4Q9GQU8_9MICO|nr:LegC family aminotransferase [Glaciihabitans arcticus]TBN55958.1 LegC family aminotransferase [Glaciihabitans arcticus]